MAQDQEIIAQQPSGEELPNDATLEPVSETIQIETVPDTTGLSFGKKIIKILRWLFPPKNKNENVFQYIIRQFWLCDSRGNPSITVTILVYVLVLVGSVAWIESMNAIKMKTTEIVKASGEIIKTAMPTGFSDTFLVLVIGLTVVITAWYRQRQKISGVEKQSGCGEVEEGLLDKVKSHVTSLIGGSK